MLRRERSTKSSSAGFINRRYGTWYVATLVVPFVTLMSVLVNGFIISPAGNFLTTEAMAVAFLRDSGSTQGAITMMMATCVGDESFSPRSGDFVEVEKIVGPWSGCTFNATKAWGRRPLLLRQSFDPESLPKWDELVTLACRSEDNNDPITSRLITHIPGRLDSYVVDFGPFDCDYLVQKLSKRGSDSPRRASTLVLNDVDRWIPDVSDWMDSHFSFLPRWRRDDAQVSLAQTGGGIGTHVDNYDVFLIQSAGSREWEIVPDHFLTVKDEYENLVPGSQVRILNMSSTESLKNVPFVTLHLEAGDCLYLPPRIVHCGTATSNDCVTLSVGCRAPSAADLITRLSEVIRSGSSPAAMRRYTDVTLMESPSSSDDPGHRRLSTGVKEAMKDLIIEAVREALYDDETFDELVGSLVTEPNRPTLNYPTPLHAMEDEWKEELGIWANATATLHEVVSRADGGCLRRAEGISFAWSCGSRISAQYDVDGNLVDEPYYRLYAQGRVFEVNEIRSDHHNMICNLLDRIANGPPLDREAVKDLGVVLTTSISSFLIELIEEGLLYGDEGSHQHDDLL